VAAQTAKIVKNYALRGDTESHVEFPHGLVDFCTSKNSFKKRVYIDAQESTPRIAAKRTRSHQIGYL
jgi:hypothetical protein